MAIGTMLEALHVQTNPPAYTISDVEVTNQEGYSKEYLPPERKSILDHGSVYMRGEVTAPATIL